jgi:hypothetical protein
MKYVFTLILFILFFHVIQAQNLEVFGGSLKNTVKICSNDTPWEESHQSSYEGYSIGIGINNLVPDSFPKLRFRITARYDEYGNYIYAYSGGRWGYSKDEVIVQKRNISLGIYPVNFKVVKDLEIGIGIELGVLLNSKTVGYRNTYYNNGNPQTPSVSTSKNYEIENNSIHYKKIIPGLVGRASYKIPLSSHFRLIPQAEYYHGLLKEYQDLVLETHSRRWSIKLGLEYKI